MWVCVCDEKEEARKGRTASSSFEAKNGEQEEVGIGFYLFGGVARVRGT